MKRSSASTRGGRRAGWQGSWTAPLLHLQLFWSRQLIWVVHVGEGRWSPGSKRPHERL